MSAERSNPRLQPAVIRQASFLWLLRPEAILNVRFPIDRFGSEVRIRQWKLPFGPEFVANGR